MKNPTPLAARIAAALADTTVASFAAAWPWSFAAMELRRAARDGFSVGSMCGVEFSVSFNARDVPGEAIDRLRAAGIVITGCADAERGFLIVRARLRLRAYDLARTESRLGRLVAPYGGYVVLIGPVPATRVDTTASMQTITPPFGVPAATQTRRKAS